MDETHQRSCKRLESNELGGQRVSKGGLHDKSARRPRD